MFGARWDGTFEASQKAERLSRLWEAAQSLSLRREAIVQCSQRNDSHDQNGLRGIAVEKPRLECLSQFHRFSEV
jgi:hypothetical protein